jgi:hypothetical protein
MIYDPMEEGGLSLPGTSRITGSVSVEMLHRFSWQRLLEACRSSECSVFWAKMFVLQYTSVVASGQSARRIEGTI